MRLSLELLVGSGVAKRSGVDAGLDTASRHQLIVGTPLDQPTPVEEQNEIGRPGPREPVGHVDHRSTFSQTGFPG